MDTGFTRMRPNDDHSLRASYLCVYPRIKRLFAYYGLWLAWFMAAVSAGSPTTATVVVVVCVHGRFAPKTCGGGGGD